MTQPDWMLRVTRRLVLTNQRASVQRSCSYATMKYEIGSDLAHFNI